jgi:hypothetical protein
MSGIPNPRELRERYINAQDGEVQTWIRQTAEWLDKNYKPGTLSPPMPSLDIEALVAEQFRAAGWDVRVEDDQRGSEGVLDGGSPVGDNGESIRCFLGENIMKPLERFLLLFCLGVCIGAFLGACDQSQHIERLEQQVRDKQQPVVIREMKVQVTAPVQYREGLPPLERSTKQ